MANKGNIAFYFSYKVSDSKTKYWLDFFASVKNELKCDIVIVVEDYDTSRLFRKNCASDTKVINIRPKINNSARMSDSVGYSVLEKYDKYGLQRLRLFFHRTKKRHLNNSETKFEDFLCICIPYLENLIEWNDIRLVCVEPKVAYSSLYIMLLEAVCDRLGRRIMFTNVAGNWGSIGIFTNSFRDSEEVSVAYRKNIRDGLADFEKDKVLRYFEHYHFFKETEWVKNLHFNRINTSEKLNTANIKRYWVKRRYLNILRAVRNQTHSLMTMGTSRQIHIKRTSDYDDFDFNNREFVIFLLSKRNNYRSHLLSPYYNDVGTLIKNIAISLPFTHSLVVKDHPHSSLDRIDTSVVEILSVLDNCYYVDPRISTLKIVEEADLVFTTTSTSGIEALTKLKHVISFGKRVFIFGENDAPIIRVNDFQHLSGIIRQCLVTPPPESEIIAYFHALLSNTYRWGDYPDDKWDKLEPSGYEKKILAIMRNGIRKLYQD